MTHACIADNFRRIRDQLPEEVALVVAAKARTLDEVTDVIKAGACIIGHNYVQEAETALRELGDVAGRVEWHMIGPLQRNKINRALPLFRVVQTVDRMSLARALNDRTPEPLRVYLEVNVGAENSKSGARLEDLPTFLQDVALLGNLRVEGLMTMEPYSEDPEKARPYFAQMKKLFDELREQSLPNVDLKVLSMGMSHSWRVAVDEGSTMVRIGTAIFGPRAG